MRALRTIPYNMATAPAIPRARNPPYGAFAFAAPVNCEITDVVGEAKVTVPFTDGDGAADGDGVNRLTVEDDDPAAEKLVVGALTDKGAVPVGAELVVEVSEARVPVRLYAAAQAARLIPYAG